MISKYGAAFTHTFLTQAQRDTHPHAIIFNKRPPAYESVSVILTDLSPIRSSQLREWMLRYQRRRNNREEYRVMLTLLVAVRYGGSSSDRAKTWGESGLEVCGGMVRKTASKAGETLWRRGGAERGPRKTLKETRERRKSSQQRRRAA